MKKKFNSETIGVLLSLDIIAEDNDRNISSLISKPIVLINLTLVYFAIWKLIPYVINYSQMLLWTAITWLDQPVFCYYFRGFMPVLQFRM